MKYYPPLSELVARETLPDISIFGGANETIQQLLDRLLSGIRFKDLVINQSAAGDVRFYSLTIVAMEMGFELPGTGISFFLFPNADGLDEADIPIEFEWRWGVKRYVNDFEAALFSHSPQDYFDLLLKVANITEAQFVDGITRIFIGDPNPYAQLAQDVKDLITDYKNGVATLDDPSGEILANADAILPGLDTLIAELLDPTQMAVPFESEVEHIADSFENLAATLDIDLDVCRLAFETVTRFVQDPAQKLDRLLVLFGTWFSGFDRRHIEELLIPQLSVTIDPVPIGIQFPPTILREVDALGKPVPDPNHAGQDKPAMLTIDVASLKYSTANGFQFDIPDSLNFDFPRSEILRSGLILELHDVKVDFSRTTNIPEAIADGRPSDFVGVYVKDGTISFPAFWKTAPGSTGVIKANNLLIGTGGFSGTLALKAITSGSNAPVAKPVVNFTFGKDPGGDPAKEFSISLDAFEIVLKQNAIKESVIEGTLMIPGLKDANDNPAKIKIKAAIRQDGDFDITGHEDDGFKTFHCGKIFDLTLKTVFLGREGDDFYLGVGGSIQFTHDLIKNVVKDKIEIEKLIIWSDGRFEIKGGTIPLPKNIRFPIGPAELSITAIHMGSHQQINADGTIRNFRYFGFDGGVDINPGGVDVRGKGIKFFYPVDLVPGDCYLEIKSIAIDLVIPGSASKETATLLISGFLSVGGTATDPLYEGGISFGLPKMKIAGGASMALRPKVPAFIIDAFVELSTPIPLGSTSLGIYGFRGLFGQRYVASKAKVNLQDTDTWFDYYKVPDPITGLQGVSISKFEGPSQTKSYDGAFSIGAGVSLATAQDDGKTFSCKLFLMLSLPDLIYLEGKANILGERVGLDGEDPPFFAMLAISSKSVEMGAGVSYQLPRDENKGWILDLNAEMRAAFFFQNSSAWYVNFGTIQNPTTARVLTIFDAYSYVMLSASGIAAGAGVSFGFNKSYAGGMVRASVGCYIKVGGFISFERPQIGGFAMMGGHVDVRLMWFSFYLAIDTSLSVEVPKPFYIQGSVHLCVGVTIGFWKFKKHIEKCFDVEFKWEKNPTVDTSPVLPFANLIANPNTLPPIMGTNMLSGESFTVAYLGGSLPSASAAEFDAAVLPLDTWVDIEFLKGLLPDPNVDARIGRLSGQAPSNTIDYIPPAEVAHKVKHEYSIKAVEIKAWNGGAWVDYRTYEAMSPPDALSAFNANPSAFKDGFWQNSGSGFNKLRLLGETSLSYMQQGQPGWYIPEQFGITSASLFCQTKLRKMQCLDWIKVPSGTIYSADAWRQTDTVLFRVSGGPGTVIDWNGHFGISRSLAFANESTAQIVFNRPCVELNLKLTTFSSGAVIRFFKRETVSPGFVYTVVETRTLTQLQLLAEVKYNDSANPVAKVEIDPINGDATAIYALQVQIDGRYRELYERNRDDQEKNALLAEIHTLEEELKRLNGLGCSPNGISKDALATQISIVNEQVEECHKDLAALVTEQKKVCKELTDFRALFNRCFPQAPSMLSYEIVEQRFGARRPRFQFRIYDDGLDVVLFNGTQFYPDGVSAERAVFDTLKLAVWPGDYALMAPRDGRYFFQLVDTSGQFVAVNPAFFTTWDDLVSSWQQTYARCRAAQVNNEFAPARRHDGKLPCDESLEHLICWKELPDLGTVDAGRCDAVRAGLLSARDVFCREYNKLYRELYTCNKQLLDELIERCEKLTREVDIKQKACGALSDQLAALNQLQDFIDQNGELIPPHEAPCSTLLHEACCLSLEDYQFNLSAPGQDAIDQDYQNAADAIQKWLTPIWRPDTKYCVRLQVTDTVNNVPSPSNDREFYFGFRTAGPVGYFHTDPFANYVDTLHNKKPDQYMLTGLKAYIDFRRSYPDASGQLIGAKPLFYEDARILLFFTKRYVYHFFGEWPAYKGLPALTGNAMQIIIKDPSENTSIPNPPPPDIITTEIPRATVDWPADDDPRIPEDIRTLLNLRDPELLNPDFQGGDCWVSGGKMITPASVYTSVVPHYLKPLKLYTAVVNNIYQGHSKEIHQYVFQTSRYPDFTAQVKSYRLDDGKGNQRDAVFRIEKSLSAADLSLMFDVVTGNMSPANLALAGSWADPFDRLLAGVMKLTPLDVATSTEFNIVSNQTTGAPVAVWIRNPEPFNDPKLPRDVLEGSLRVMDNLNVDLRYKVLFSKDGSQAFVMHPARVIPVTRLKFRFTYIEWDGSDYVERTVVLSDFIPTPTVAGVSAATTL